MARSLRPTRSLLVLAAIAAAAAVALPLWALAAAGRGEPRGPGVGDRAQSPPVAAKLVLRWQPAGKPKPTMSLTARVGSSFDLSRIRGTLDDRFELSASGQWRTLGRGNRLALDLRAQASETKPTQDTTPTDAGPVVHTTYHRVMAVTIQTSTWIETDEATALSDTDAGKLTLKLTPIQP